MYDYKVKYPGVEKGYEKVSSSSMLDIPSAKEGTKPKEEKKPTLLEKVLSAIGI